VLLLDAYKQGAAHIALVYTSLDQVDGSSRWTVDDFTVEDVANALVTSPLAFDFGAVAAGQASEANTFTLKALGFSDNLTVTVPANFEVAKENAEGAFSQSVTYTPAEAATENTVYVRFKPATTALSFAGKFTFASGETFSEERGQLIGSSIPKSTTLDVVTWNVEWFGADVDGDGRTLGPSDDALQYANVKQAILALDADIYALQEIANDEAMEALVNDLPGYSFVKSDTYSYSQREASFVSTPQKLYVVYKTPTVQVKGEKVLLQKLYTDVLANDVVLPNYPGSGADASNDDSFWASGRLPYMVILDATINGITQRLHLLNIHARANSGSNMTVYNQRNYDLQVLKDSLDAQYPNVNLIMLGDYNDDVDMAVVGTNNPSTYKSFVEDEAYNVLTYDLSLTGAGTYNASSFLDHITVSRSLNDDYIENSISIENGLVNLIPRYFTTTSDHLPVSARFDLSATPAVTFSEASVTKAEDAVKFNVNLTLSAAPAAPQTVYISVQEGATASAEDYTTAPAANEGVITLTVPVGATSAAFEVQLADDTQKEEDEAVTFLIYSTSADLGVGEQRTFTLTIEDNDQTPTGIADATKGQFSVFPNPVQDFVRLSLPDRVSAFPNISLVAYGLDGRMLFSARGSLEGVQQVLNGEVASLKHGLYILKIEAGKEVFVTRMLKK
ncbi:MAG: hypothetical protein LPK14_06245, partial [Hymenobacteraceae bacterium]|nr:hypothetical protein [Hymenobacteraceae bacterium]